MGVGSDAIGHVGYTLIVLYVSSRLYEFNQIFKGKILIFLMTMETLVHFLWTKTHAHVCHPSL